ncbi:MAG TPA: hypothetical protein VFT29_06255 [Gemmatimonadaceae bacterium]|nr:hypothetical protein [Gemmatimonadaceae bacterium]
MSRRKSFQERVVLGLSVVVFGILNLVPGIFGRGGNAYAGYGGGGGGGGGVCNQYCWYFCDASGCASAGSNCIPGYCGDGICKQYGLATVWCVTS